MPFRVVFLTHNFPRHSGDLSGAFLATLAHALIDRGHEIRVLAPSDLGDVGPPEFEGIPVTRVRYASDSQETLAYRGNMQEAVRNPTGWRALVGLWRALRRAAGSELDRGADLVHAHWWVPGGLASPPNHPLVLTVHGTDGALLRRSSLARWVAAPVFRRARVVTTVSQALARDVQSILGRAVPEHCIQPMPAQVTGFSRWSAGGAGLIVIARLTPQKRVALAIRAVGLLAGRGHPVHLCIVGDGQERRDLENLVSQLNLQSQVKFMGAAAPKEIPGLLDDSDAMVFPAVSEGFGLVAAEAFMAGVPVVVCRDGGGVLDLVPEQGAGRWADATPEALAAAIEGITGDPSARSAARQLGEQWRNRLAPARVAELCEQWYTEAVRA